MCVAVFDLAFGKSPFEVNQFVAELNIVEPMRFIPMDTDIIRLVFFTERTGENAEFMMSYPVDKALALRRGEPISAMFISRRLIWGMRGGR